MPREGQIRATPPRMRQGMKREYAPSYERRRHVMWGGKLVPTPLFIRMLRNKMLQLTQTELAQLMEVTQGTISTWECGHKVPQRRQWLMLRRLAEEHEQREKDRIARGER